MCDARCVDVGRRLHQPSTGLASPIEPLGPLWDRCESVVDIGALRRARELEEGFVSTNLQGRLTRDDLAQGMPCGDPLFTNPPHYWQDIERVTLTWRTDLEACLKLCPDCMEVDPSATARVLLYHFNWCSAGPYHEASLQFRVNYGGEPYWFECKNLVDSDVGFAAGRELFGIPKKMGWATWENNPQLGLNIEFGRGTKAPIIAAQFFPKVPFEPEGELASLSVRVIPTGVGGDPEIKVFNGNDPRQTEFRINEGGYAYKGLGSVAFQARSLLDPWHQFEVREMLDAEYVGGSTFFKMGTGKVVHTY